MNKLLRVFLASAFALSLCSAASAADAAKPVEEVKAVSMAVDNFYSALNILFTGNGQPMKDAWSYR